MQLSGKNILGNIESAEGKTTFYANNPATGEALEVEFIEATQDEVDKAVVDRKEQCPYNQPNQYERHLFAATVTR